jgi:DHA1 family bicyclomycin/chloramphenicol resistance-like MFS transporter
MPADGMKDEDAKQARPRAAAPPFYLLVLLTSASPFALNAINPAMPGMADDFGVPYAVIQLILTLALISFGLAQLIVGPLSDRFGRRPVALLGLALFSLGSLVSSLAPSPEVVILGRVVQAGGGAMSMVLARTIVHDTHDRGQATTVISYMVMVMVLAPMIATVIGGVMAEHLGWRPIFLLVMACGLVVLILASALLKETNRLAGSGRTLPQILREARGLFAVPLFWGYTGAASFASGMFFSFVGVAPFVVEKVMGRPQTDYGLYFLFMSAGYIAGNFISGRYSSRLGPSRMIGFGVVAAGLGMVLFWLLLGWHHPAAIFVPMMLVTFSNGITLPNATVGAMTVKPDVAGSASGVTGMIQMIVAAGLTAAVGLFESESRLAMTVALTATWVLSAVSWCIVRGAAGGGR